MNQKIEELQKTIKEAEQQIAAKSKLGDKPFIPKGFVAMKRVDSREVVVLKSLLRKLKTYMDNTESTTKEKLGWNSGIGICMGEIKTRIEKESKIKHYAKG